MKKLFLIAMGLFWIPVVWADLNDGLIAHYPFNGNAHDVSVNGNHANVHGPVLIEDRSGNPDSAYSFDGVDDFMNAGPIMKKLVDFSISVWIKTEQIAASSWNADAAIIGTKQGNGNTNDFMLATHNGRLSWYSELGTGSGDAGKYVSDNLWHHVVVVRTNSSLTFYVDGIKKDSFSGGADAVNNNDIEIGRVHWDDNSRYNTSASGFTYFNGNIDDIYIYNRALTESEIKQLNQINNQTVPNNNCTEADLEKARNQAKEEAKKACQADPASCGINVGNEINLDEVRNKAKEEAKKACQANPASCGIDLNGEVAAAVIESDLSLHVSKAQYKTLLTTQQLWIDMKFFGKNDDGNLLWELSGYGEVK